MDRFEVVPDVLRRVAGNLISEADDVRRSGLLASDGMTSAGGAAGEGPLAGALAALGAEVRRCTGATAARLDTASTALWDSAATYVGADESAVSRMQPVHP